MENWGNKTHTQAHTPEHNREISEPQSKEAILKVPKEKAQITCKGNTIRLRSGLSATEDPSVEQRLKALRGNRWISVITCKVSTRAAGKSAGRDRRAQGETVRSQQVRDQVTPPGGMRQDTQSMLLTFLN